MVGVFDEATKRAHRAPRSADQLNDITQWVSVGSAGLRQLSGWV